MKFAQKKRFHCKILRSLFFQKLVVFSRLGVNFLSQEKSSVLEAAQLARISANKAQFNQNRLKWKKDNGIVVL